MYKCTAIFRDHKHHVCNYKYNLYNFLISFHIISISITTMPVLSNDRVGGGADALVREKLIRRSMGISQSVDPVSKRYSVAGGSSSSTASKPLLSARGPAPSSTAGNPLLSARSKSTENAHKHRG